MEHALLITSYNHIILLQISSCNPLFLFINLRREQIESYFLKDTYIYTHNIRNNQETKNQMTDKENKNPALTAS